MICNRCIEKDETIQAAESIIKKLTEAVDNANLALDVLNTKVLEQETTIMKLNNGLMKATKIGGFRNNVMGNR